MSFEGWLKDLEGQVKESVRGSRAFNSFFHEVFCNNDDFIMWKKNGRDETVQINGGTLTQIAPYKPETVKPAELRLRVRNDWKEAYEQKVFIVLGGLSRHIFGWEHKQALATLASKAKTYEIESDVPTRPLLNGAIDNINSEDNYADTLLVSPLQLTNLMDVKGFIPYWNFPENFVNQKGSGFIGIMGELSIYHTPALAITEGLLYDKSQTRLRKTPLSIKFENYENPEYLEVAEKIFAWPVDDYSIARLHFLKK